MKREKLLELAAHGTDVGRPRDKTDYKAIRAEQERAGDAVQKAEDAHRRFGAVERTLKDALQELEVAVIRIEEDEHYHRRVLNQEPACAADYAYIRSVLCQLIAAVKEARKKNDAMGEPTAAKLKAAASKVKLPF